MAMPCEIVGCPALAASDGWCVVHAEQMKRRREDDEVDVRHLVEQLDDALMDVDGGVIGPYGALDRVRSAVEDFKKSREVSA